MNVDPIDPFEPLDDHAQADAADHGADDHAAAADLHADASGGESEAPLLLPPDPVTGDEVKHDYQPPAIGDMDLGSATA